MKKLFFIAFLTIAQMLHAQTIINLYDGIIPNNKENVRDEIDLGEGRIAGVTKPKLIAFLPAKQDSFRTAVIICPGGGYARLAMNHEGYDVAKAFNDAGIAAFILKYRIPNDSFMVHKEIVPLMDAERAMELVKQNAKQWNIDTNRIGIIGFSAGGHLASTLATHFNEVVIENKNRFNLRPAFAILGYPVVNLFEPLAHKGSRDNLLCKTPSEDLLKHFSNDLQVTAQTPPTFLVHAMDDKTVPVENSINFYNALKLNKVAGEMYLFQNGGHGFGLNNKTTKTKWFPLMLNWLVSNKMMKGDLL
ncbi:MAG: alpha/beta hydrolase [Chitinophaga sp.]|jgi:acetyl esterase/lipase|nr:alpha/beta hydrolase [Chitinophaga sp.]